MYTKLGNYDSIHDEILDYLYEQNLDYEESRSTEAGNFRSIYITGIMDYMEEDDLTQFGLSSDELEGILKSDELREELENNDLLKMRVGNHANHQMGFRDTYYNDKELLDWKDSGVQDDIARYKSDLLYVISDFIENYLEDRKED